MRRRFVFVLFLLATAEAVAAQTLAITTAQRAEIDRLAAELHTKVVETRRDLHRHPELGYRETRTAALIADRLRALGFDEVRTGVGKTGVVGILQGGRPGEVVAVRADMDALPIPELIDVPYKSIVDGVKHACGHDAHVAMALGVAEVLSRLRAQVAGTVLMLFQPAEEGDPDGGRTGALQMLDEGLFANPKPSAIFGMHVLPTIDAGTIGLNIGPAMASADRFTLTVVGQKTHGAYPHTGIDPVPIAAQIVTALQTIPSRQINAQQPTVVSVGEIKGGKPLQHHRRHGGTHRNRAHAKQGRPGDGAGKDGGDCQGDHQCVRRDLHVALRGGHHRDVQRAGAGPSDARRAGCRGR